jgi:membrane associated rhomboid family serine protease
VLVALDALAYPLSSRHAGLLPVLLDILLLVLLGPTVESALGRMRFGALCLLGGLLAVAVRALLGGGAPAPAIFAAGGASAAVLGGYLGLYPRARVLSMILVPFFAGLVELPVALFLGAWLLAQISFGVLGLEYRLGGGSATCIAQLGGFLLGVGTLGPFAMRVGSHA